MASLLFPTLIIRVNIKGWKKIHPATTINTTTLSVIFSARHLHGSVLSRSFKMNSKILSAFLVLTLVLSIVVQSDAFAPPENTNKKNGFRRQAADVAGCKKVRFCFSCKQILF